MLSEAGYPNGEGFPAIEILYNTNEGHRKIAVALQEMWKDYLNIDIKLLNQEWKVYLATESAGDYQISRGGWIGDYVDPNNIDDFMQLIKHAIMDEEHRKCREENISQASLRTWKDVAVHLNQLLDH